MKFLLILIISMLIVTPAISKKKDGDKEHSILGALTANQPNKDKISLKIEFTGVMSMSTQ